MCIIIRYLHWPFKRAERIKNVVKKDFMDKLTLKEAPKSFETARNLGTSMSRDPREVHAKKKNKDGFPFP